MCFRHHAPLAFGPVAGEVVLMHHCGLGDAHRRPRAQGDVAQAHGAKQVAATTRLEEGADVAVRLRLQRRYQNAPVVRRSVAGEALLMHQRGVHDAHGRSSAVAAPAQAHEAKQVVRAEPRGKLLKKTLEARLRWSFQRGHAAASSVCCGGWGSHPHAPARPWQCPRTPQSTGICSQSS